MSFKMLQNRHLLIDFSDLGLGKSSNNLFKTASHNFGLILLASLEVIVVIRAVICSLTDIQENGKKIIKVIDLMCIDLLLAVT